jgi:hypothetical protein
MALTAIQATATILPMVPGGAYGHRDFDHREHFDHDRFERHAFNSHVFGGAGFHNGRALGRGGGHFGGGGGHR